MPPFQVLAADDVVAAPSERDVALARSGRGLMGLRDQTVVVGADDLAGNDYVLLDLMVGRMSIGWTDDCLMTNGMPACW